MEAKSGYGLRLDDELKQLRVVQALDSIHPIDLVPTFLGAHVVPIERRSERDAYVSEVVERMIPEVARQRLARFCDVFVDEIAFTPDEAERILKTTCISHGFAEDSKIAEFRPDRGFECLGTRDRFARILDAALSTERQGEIDPAVRPADAVDGPDPPADGHAHPAGRDQRVRRATEPVRYLMLRQKARRRE